MAVFPLRQRSRLARSLYWACALLLCHCAALATPPECQPLMDPRHINFDFSHQRWPLQHQQIPPQALIGQIHFQRLPIFNLQDPAENNWLFRAANRYHIDTREQVLRDELLFASGDTYTPRLLEESARRLRQKSYLYDAQVFPLQVCDHRVEVMVLTRDVWTLIPGISLSRTGGVSSRSLLLRDSNFLGWGKRLSLSRKDGVDREGWEFEYRDDNLLSRRLELALSYADNDDGERRQLALARPFYALDSRWSLSADTDSNERTDKLYRRGDSFAEFRTREHRHRLSGGLSDGWQRNITRRWWFGLDWHRQEFAPIPGEVPPSQFPADREINTLWLGRQKIEDRFTTLHNFNQIYRTEDINFGKRWLVKLGWADSAWGSDRDRLFYSYQFDNIRALGEDRLLGYRLALEGFWDADHNRSDDLRLSGRWRYYQRRSATLADFASLQLDYARKLPRNEQLLLGGEENLRGYPLRYQSGDRRFLLTLERRYYAKRHWWRLFRLGGAAFIDIGRAWFPGQGDSGATGVLANVGLGLRITSSRAEKNRVLHIDLAFPLRREEDVDTVQWVLSGKQTF